MLLQAFHTNGVHDLIILGKIYCMKKTILFLLITLFAWGAHAQVQEARAALANTVAQKFSLSAEIAKQAVRIEEITAQRLLNLDMPHAETSLGKAGLAKAREEARQQKAQQLATLLKDEAKAHEVGTFLDGKIDLRDELRRKGLRKR